MTKATKKGKFASRGKSILNPDKPTDISSFLEDEDKEKIVRKAVKPEIRKAVKTETRTKPKKSEKPTPKTVREEFRLPYGLSEKLRKYAFDNRTTKTAVVTDALEKFFD